jgi:hypothetical protein
MLTSDCLSQILFWLDTVMRSHTFPCDANRNDDWIQKPSFALLHVFKDPTHKFNGTALSANDDSYRGVSR